jgi:ATP-dependent DNA helicase RecG
VEQEELAALVAVLRTSRTDLADVEAKSASGGLPKSVRETLSAFSNGHGGTVVLGIDERTGFTLSPGFDAARIRDNLAAACADELEPPIRADVSLVGFDGGTVVVAEISELDPRFKPCYVKARGEYNGSFIRGGDGDRRLTDFEIHLLHTNRGQPEDDRQVVVGATLDDLDPDSLSYLLRRVRQRQRRAFQGLDDTTALRRLNVLAPSGQGTLAPTVGGLLALGSYPQHFFPQLDATLVVYPGVTAADVSPGGPRFLDSRTFEGPIPVIVEEAVAAIVRNTSVRSYVQDIGREDVFDYPIEALREVIVNALIHRDYSPYSRGTPVQIALYSDRLTVTSPGGLFGVVTEDDLGEEGISSTRNPVLVKLLQDVPLPDQDRTVCENRASGIPAMIRELRGIGSALPEFQNRITRFRVVLPRHALLSPSTVEWLGTINASQRPQLQRLILAQLRESGTASVQVLRNLQPDAREFGTAITDLIAAGYIGRVGGRESAHFHLLVSPSMTMISSPTNRVTSEPTGNRQARQREAAVLRVLGDNAEHTRAELEASTDISGPALIRTLNRLIGRGEVEATAAPSSPRRKYRLVSR